jgi:hypothetical protein
MVRGDRMGWGEIGKKCIARVVAQFRKGNLESELCAVVQFFWDPLLDPMASVPSNSSQ